MTPDERDAWSRREAMAVSRSDGHDRHVAMHAHTVLMGDVWAREWFAKFGSRYWPGRLTA